MDGPIQATSPLPQPARRGPSWSFLLGWLMLACALAIGLIGWSASARTFTELGQAARLALSASRQPGGPVAQAGAWWHRVAGETCTLTHLEVARHPLDIPPEVTVCGNVTVLGANVSIEGTVRGDVRVIGGSADIQGKVTGNIYVMHGDVTLWPLAQVDGKMHVWGGEAHRVGQNISPQLVSTSELPLDTMQPLLGSGLPAWWQLAFWALFGCALALLFPSQIRAIEAGIFRAPVKSLLVGAMVTILTILLAAILAITLVGIPIALLTLAIGWVGWALGTVALGYALSQAVLGKRLNVPFVLSTLLGLVALVGLEQLPWVGWAVTLLFGCIGVGATFRWSAGRLLSRRR